MIRKILIAGILISGCFGINLEYDTFEAEFVQKVKNKSGKTIVYSGKLIAKKPDLALWEYVKPIKKSVYLNKDTLIVYEPLLLQAKYLKKSGSISLDGILKGAKILAKDEYIAKDGDTTYKFKVSDNMIERLTYTDSLENDTEIIFSNRKKNISLPQKLFVFTPPTDIDIIK